jgi:hypothetical protein
MFLKQEIYKVKLQASSILEVVIAMLLVTIIMSISMVIFSNIMKSSFNTRKIEAFARIKVLSIATKKEKRFITEEYLEADYKIQKQVENYANTSGIIQIKWFAEDKDKKLLAEYREIVSENNSDE